MRPAIEKELSSGAALTVTGHSLGAGVASLLAVALRRPEEAAAAREAAAAAAAAAATAAATAAVAAEVEGTGTPVKAPHSSATLQDKVPSFLSDLVSRAKENVDKARSTIEESEAGSRILSEASTAATTIGAVLGVGEPFQSASVGAGGFDARCFAFATPSCASPELAASPAFRSVTSVVHGDDVIPRSSEANLLRLLVELQRNAHSWSERSKAELTEAEQEYLVFLDDAAGGVRESVGSALSALREAHASLPESVLRSHGSRVERELQRAEEDLAKTLAEFKDAAEEFGKGAFKDLRKGVDTVLSEGTSTPGGDGRVENEDVGAGEGPSMQVCLRVDGAALVLVVRIVDEEQKTYHLPPPVPLPKSTKGTPHPRLDILSPEEVARKGRSPRW